MKYLLFFFAALFFISCKQQKKAPSEVELPKTVEKSYPEDLQTIFEAHGGLDQWKKQRTLTYTLPKKEFSEVHTTDLWSRHDKVETQAFSMGFDGKTWLLDEEEVYKGNPEFYHNLMFYFYAMPFVLADDGINYAATEPLEFEGKSYPGLAISYNSGVGTSPKDEYYIHYDPETHQMAWLGYTVTYRTGEDSDNVKWIRYNDWMKTEGLVLPSSISWYNYEGRTIKDLRSTVEFEEVSISEVSKPKSFYAKPESAIYFKRGS